MENQYFTDSAPATEDEQHMLSLDVRGRELRMRVSDRVFSGQRLDLGTRQLLEEAPEPPQSGTFLDLGCGWGPIAVTLGLEAPGAEVWAVDVNTRALDLTERNAHDNGADNVIAIPAEEALQRARTKDVRFDRIWSNPPVRIGKAALHGLLLDWLGLLAPDGTAVLVVQRNLGADSLTRWLEGQGFTIRRLASKKGYRILEVRTAA